MAVLRGLTIAHHSFLEMSAMVPEILVYQSSGCIAPCFLDLVFVIVNFLEKCGVLKWITEFSGYCVLLYKS